MPKFQMSKEARHERAVLAANVRWAKKLIAPAKTEPRPSDETKSDTGCTPGKPAKPELSEAELLEQRLARWWAMPAHERPVIDQAIIDRVDRRDARLRGQLTSFIKPD